MNFTASVLQVVARNSSTPWMSFFLSRSGMAQTRNFSKATDSASARGKTPPTSWIDPSTSLTTLRPLTFSA